MLWDKTPPKMPLSSFSAGHLLSMQPTLKSSLFLQGYFPEKKLNFWLQVVIIGDRFHVRSGVMSLDLSAPWSYLVQASASSVHAASALWVHMCFHPVDLEVLFPWCPPSSLSLTSFIPPLPFHVSMSICAAEVQQIFSLVLMRLYVVSFWLYWRHSITASPQSSSLKSSHALFHIIPWILDIGVFSRSIN